MALGDTFDSLGQPGPSAAPAPASAPVGGVMSNDHVMEAVKTNPVQVARIAAEASRQALQRLAVQLSKARNGV